MLHRDMDGNRWQLNMLSMFGIIIAMQYKKELASADEVRCENKLVCKKKTSSYSASFQKFPNGLCYSVHKYYSAAKKNTSH